MMTDFEVQTTIQYPNPQTDPSKTWSGGNVKDTNNVTYFLPPSYPASNFQKGQVVKLAGTTKQTGRGPQHTITHVNDQAIGGPQAVGQALGTTPLPPLAAPQGLAPAPMTGPPAVPVYHTIPASQAPSDKGMDIFLTGVVQQAMSTGKFGANDIKVLALAARDAWKAAHSAEALAPMPDGRPAPPSNDDIDF